MHTPLTVVPGHEVPDNSEHVTVTPVVAVMLVTGPVIVVANFDATDRHCRYAKKIIIHLSDTKIEFIELHFQYLVTN